MRLLTLHSIAKVNKQPSCSPPQRQSPVRLFAQTPRHALPNCFLSADVDSTAEAALKQESSKPQYALTLLNIVNSDTIPLTARLAAALAFKNFIKSNYVVCSGSVCTEKGSIGRG